MKVFWRKVPLSHNERALYRKLLDAHHKASFRQNLSSEVIKAAYGGNGNDCIKAVASGLGTLGGLHAPVIQTYEILEYQLQAEGQTGWVIPDGMHVPGWGNSFVRGRPDPIVEIPMIYIQVGWPKIGGRIKFITDMLHDKGKVVYPNMACVTAATAIILGLPKTLSPMLLLLGRVEAWAELIHDSTRQSPKAQVRHNRERVQ